LGAGGAGDELDGERSDTGGGNLLNDFGGAEGAEKADQELTLTHEREVRFASDVIRAVAKDLHNNVCSGEYGSAIGKNLSALFYVGCIGITGLVTGTGLDDHLHTRFSESRDDGWNKGDTAFSGIAFLGDSNNHAVILFWLGELN
jgi:hypothetical protein